MKEQSTIAEMAMRQTLAYIEGLAAGALENPFLIVPSLKVTLETICKRASQTLEAHP